MSGRGLRGQSVLGLLVVLVALGGLLLAVGRADAMTATAPAAASATCASGMVPAGETGESTWSGLQSAVAGVPSNASGAFALQATITAGDSAGDQLAVPAGASVTIDLCGFALSITSPPVEDAAVAVPATSTFTVVDNSSGQNGMLTAVASSAASNPNAATGAGIGGDGDGTASGVVNLESGSVTATGGAASNYGGGAGIGSGGGGNSNAGGSGAITISTDGTVTATGGAGNAGGGAGIGGGGNDSYSDGGDLAGDVSITNATVSATGGSGNMYNNGGGAGIGGGGAGLEGSSGGTVTHAVVLIDATVTATGGSGDPGGDAGGAGAGIGGGGGGGGVGGESSPGGQLNADVDVTATQLQVSPGNSGHGTAYGIGQGAPGFYGTDNGSGSGSVQVTGSGLTVLSGNGTVPATVSAAVNVTGGELGVPSGQGAALSGAVSVGTDVEVAVEPDSTLTVSGSLVNDGAVGIFGTVTVTGSFTNNAIVDLAGTLTLGSGAENASSGQIFLEGGVLDGGPVSNDGSIASDGQGVAPTGTVNATIDNHSYDLGLNPGTGSVSPSSEEVYAATLGDADQILPTPTPPSGGTFDGWYTAVSGGTQVTPSSELSSTPGPEDIQLYALYGFSQAVSFTQPSSPVTVGQSAALSATGGASGQPVSFSVDAASSPTDACTVSESTSGQYSVSYEHAGSCVIDANEAAGQTGQDTYSAAPQVQQTVTVTQASQSITFTQPASPATAGSAATLNATGGASGQPVSFSVDPSSGTGVCTVANTDGGGSVSYLQAGSCVIDANQAGSSDYTAAPQVQQTVSVQAAPTPAPTATTPAPPTPAPTTTTTPAPPTPAPTTTTTPAPTTTTAPPAPSPPSARATVSAGPAGLTYVFSAAHSNANGAHISSYAWTLDGKQIGTGPRITHTFPQAGKPEAVVLTVHSSDGTSAQSTVHLTPRGARRTVRLTLHFIADHAALTTTDRDDLIKLRSIFAHASTVHIAGYSAAQSTRTSGVLLRLSHQRADMVLAFLRAGQNHTTPTVALTGYGASHFITTNTTAHGRAQNRRATLTITYLKPTI
jgi:outer membrane protein OmpA-like peptidoglycan-associated protein